MDGQYQQIRPKDCFSPPMLCKQEEYRQIHQGIELYEDDGSPVGCGKPVWLIPNNCPHDVHEHHSGWGLLLGGRLAMGSHTMLIDRCSPEVFRGESTHRVPDMTNSTRQASVPFELLCIMPTDFKTMIPTHRLGPVTEMAFSLTGRIAGDDVNVHKMQLTKSPPPCRR